MVFDEMPKNYIETIKKGKLPIRTRNKKDEIYNKSLK